MTKKIIILVVIALMSVTSIFAQGGTTGPLTWQITGTGNNLTLTISGNGAMPDYGETPEQTWVNAPWSDYLFNIRMIKIEYGVTSIGKNAFYTNGLFFPAQFPVSVTISNSVTSIGEAAFATGYIIEELNIPNSVITIGKEAFYFCRINLINIGNNVESIGNSAFGGCQGVSSLTIPNSVTTIGRGAFFDCIDLIQITIPNNFTSIEDETFSGCSALKTFSIPSNVTSIGNYAFKGCASLSSIAIPNGITAIGKEAFMNCTGLTSITNLPITPPNLGTNAFQNVSRDILLTVPCNSFGAYADSDWNYFNYFKIVPTEICMVSVDENNHNVVVCKNLLESQGCDVGYNIYRESTISGQYDLVHSIPANTSNVWVDMESNANIRSYRYKISYKINDYISQNLSPAHKTMHLTINVGVGNSWNLIWTPYEGASYSTYNIYRSSGDSIGELQLIGTMPAGNTSFSDFSAPQGYVYYMVEIVLNETCNFGKAGSSIKSNIATNKPLAIDESVAISNITIYPNPTTGVLRIENGELRIINVEIFDVLGQKVLSPMSSMSPETVIDISHLTAGLYFLKINTEVGQVIKKVLKD